MISENTASAAVTQVNQIINALDEEDRKKIPKSVTNFFKKYSDNNEKYLLDLNIPLEEQNVSMETKALLKYIYSYIK